MTAHMIQAYLDRYIQANPHAIDWSEDEDYIFTEKDFSIRIGDENFEYSHDGETWQPLETVSQLRKLLATA